MPAGDFSYLYIRWSGVWVTSTTKKKVEFELEIERSIDKKKIEF